MSETSIEWTDRTWNPVRGCDKVSPGCKHCYAETFAERFRGVKGHPYEQGFDLRLVPEKLAEPLTWRKPQRVFVNSMSDLFHEDVPDEFIDRVLAVIALCPRHTFQVLTKRADRMERYFAAPGLYERILRAADRVRAQRPGLSGIPISDPRRFPLANLWLGVSVEDQRRADERIPRLRATPAAVRFVSGEPMLGAVDLCSHLRGIDWVIVGGESGHDSRPFDLAWARSIVGQCRDAGVACFVKQIGARPYEERAADGRPQGIDFALANLGSNHPQRPWFDDWTLVHVGDESKWMRYPRLINRKGGDPAEWPEDLRVREWPRGGT